MKNSMRQVAVWGDGYLAYTLMLGLQHYVEMFFIRRFTGDSRPATDYPSAIQTTSWSRIGALPRVDEGRIQFSESDDLIENDNIFLHFVCIPSQYISRPYNENFQKLASLFLNRRSHTPVHIIFCSASGPGSIQREFLNPLAMKPWLKSVSCMFRADWCIEDFFKAKAKTIVSSSSDTGREVVLRVAGLMPQPYQLIDSLQEAEFVEQSRNALEFTLYSAISQLAAAFPQIAVRNHQDLLLERVRNRELDSGLYMGGYRLPGSVEHLLEETTATETLSVLQEAGASSLSATMSVAEMVLRKGFRKILFLGIAPQNDFYQSPALILAGVLRKGGCVVALCDPEIKNLSSVLNLKEYTQLELEESKTYDYEVLVVGSPHPRFRLLEAQELKAMFPQCRLILDDFAIWSGQASEFNGVYHRFGDGDLRVLG